MKKLIFLFILSGELFSSPIEDCVITSIKGKVQIREAYQTEWKDTKVETVLCERVTIRSDIKSSATIQTCEGTIFNLPPDAQVEIRELRKLDRNEVIMELTAIELQRLPTCSDTSRHGTGFILHGSIRERPENAESQRYVSMEINGALALFEQGYLGGFIIKWNKLNNAFPDLKSDAADAALKQAYKMMKMPKRLSALEKM